MATMTVDLGSVIGPQGPKGDTGAPAACNLLDNSDFSNPINQRSITSTSAAGYHIDRWKKGNTSGTVTIGDGYLSMTGNGAYWFLTQNIPAEKIKSGKTYTIALADTEDNISVYSTTFSEDMAKFSAGYNFPNGARVATNVEYGTGQYALYFTSNSTEETKFAWAAVYEGAYTVDTLPEYIPRGYAAEMAECQRYYYQTAPELKNATGAVILTATVLPSSTSSFSLESVDLPVEMRIVPTITIYSHNGTAGKVGTFYTANEVAGVAAYQTRKRFAVRNEDGAFVGGNTYYFHYAASADL